MDRLLLIFSDICIRLCISAPRIFGIFVLDFTWINKRVLSLLATMSAGPLLPFEKNTAQP